MITTERSVFIGAHLTQEQKELIRLEAQKRNMSMSALVSQVLEEWLDFADQEQIEPMRSNKRIPLEEDVPLPLEG